MKARKLQKKKNVIIDKINKLYDKKSKKDLFVCSFVCLKRAHRNTCDAEGVLKAPRWIKQMNNMVLFVQTSPLYSLLLY
jgi:hypothetical protein